MLDICWYAIDEIQKYPESRIKDQAIYTKAFISVGIVREQNFILLSG